LLWHICRSCWQDLKHVLRELNQISSCALQSGTEAVSKGGSLWRVSWLLLGACQEVTPKNQRRSARDKGRISMGRILHGKILRARVNQAFPQAPYEKARASVKRSSC
jgi:hypothetical protein